MTLPSSPAAIPLAGNPDMSQHICSDTPVATPFVNVPKYQVILPPPRGKHRYSSHQTLVEDVHTFIKHIPVCNSTQESGYGNGTTWIEVYCMFYIMGYNSDHTKEAYMEALADDRTSQREKDRNSTWIAHRLLHEKSNSNELKKPLATAEEKRSLASELETFKRVVTFVSNHTGNSQVRKCFEAT